MTKPAKEDTCPICKGARWVCEDDFEANLVSAGGQYFVVRSIDDVQDRSVID
jgi:hypothetical protein